MRGTCAARGLLGAWGDLTQAPNAVGPRARVSLIGARRGRWRASADQARHLGNVRLVLRQGAHVDRRGRERAREVARARVSDLYLDALGVARAGLVVVRSLNDRGGRVRRADHIVEAAHLPRSASLGVLELTPTDFALPARRCTRGRAGQSDRAVGAGRRERRVALSIGDAGDPTAHALRCGCRVVRPPIACRSLRHGGHLASAPDQEDQRTSDRGRSPLHVSIVAPLAEALLGAGIVRHAAFRDVAAVHHHGDVVSARDAVCRAAAARRAGVGVGGPAVHCGVDASIHRRGVSSRVCGGVREEGVLVPEVAAECAVRASIEVGDWVVGEGDSRAGRVETGAAVRGRAERPGEPAGHALRDAVRAEGLGPRAVWLLGDRRIAARRTGISAVRRRVAAGAGIRRALPPRAQSPGPRQRHPAAARAVRQGSDPTPTNASAAYWATIGGRPHSAADRVACHASLPADGRAQWAPTAPNRLSQRVDSNKQKSLLRTRRYFDWSPNESTGARRAARVFATT